MVKTKNKKIEEIIKQTNADLCIDCGECTGSCPISRVNLEYSPRLSVEKLVLGYFDEIKRDDDLWSCLTCGLCTVRCPSNVDYNKFIRLARREMRLVTDNLNYSHNRILQKSMEVMSGGGKQNRTDWIDKENKTSKKSDYLFFTGCLPHFDVIFEYLGIEPTRSGRNAIKILNEIGIEPIVSNDEVCCGRDLLYNGDEERFIKLAKLNKKMIKNTGAKTIIFMCPECLETIKKVYPEYVGKINVQMLHITQVIDEAISDNKLELKPSNLKSFTFQDPCSLGRGLGIYDEPRNILKSIPECELKPMERERDDSICCGPSAWLSCTNNTKRIQAVRLGQAQKTGAQVLVTACPKCTIHLSCALSSEDINYDIKIMDITTLVAENIKEKKAHRLTQNRMINTD
jgi:heterodisulfide reductase subunit D